MFEVLESVNGESMLKVSGTLSLLLVVLGALYKIGAGLVWMYSNDEANFSEAAKGVLQQLRQPLNKLKFDGSKISTDRVEVDCNGWWICNRKPKVKVNDTQKGKSYELFPSFPERRVIRQVVRSRMVDQQRKDERDLTGTVNSILS